MRILLDTSAFSELKRGNEAVADLVRNAERILFSVVVAGELQYGYHRGTACAANLSDLKAFLANPFVMLLPVTFETADRYGRIACRLRDKGRPIPTNDIWIAAHALETGAALVSFDVHFAEVDGLVWVNPAGP